MIERTCKNQDEARALANFLWNEKERHRDDILTIDEDLKKLYTKWSVSPSYMREFVKP